MKDEKAFFYACPPMYCGGNRELRAIHYLITFYLQFLIYYSWKLVFD